MSERSAPGADAHPPADLDPRAVLDALGAGEAEVLERVTGGRDTAIWRVRRGDEVAALRVFRPEQARAAALEAATLAAAGAAGLPVPMVLARGDWRGRPAVLISWLPGRPMLAELRARPWRAWPLGRAFGAMQARVHRAPPPPELAERPGWVSRMGEGEPALRARLERVATGRALLHLDYHPLNVLVDGGGRVTGVIDWIDAAIGDPRADLARTFVVLRLEPAPLPPGPQAAAFWLLRRLLAAGWWRGYREVAGPVEGMAPFMAWAGVALAAALERRRARGEPGLEPRHAEAARRWARGWTARALRG